jgi:hypothetical protein
MFWRRFKLWVSLPDGQVASNGVLFTYGNAANSK